ncbi:MAG TPA: hypothetical protein VFC97_02930, partial [Verrucomicrobiae bacterium]|nr:hypothetical protein [Verrucomicrobiae bacterium]
RQSNGSGVGAVPRRAGAFLGAGASLRARVPRGSVIDGIELLAELFDPAGFVDVAPPGGWVPVE